MAEDILPGVDHELVRALKRAFEAKSIQLLTSSAIDTVELTASVVKLTSGGQDYFADYLLSAVGRKPNSGRLQHSGCMNFPLRRICGGIAGGSGRDQQKGDCDFTNDKHRISSDFHRSITIGVITPERNVVVAFRNLSSAF